MGEAAEALIRESKVIGGHLVSIASAVRGRDDEIRADAAKIDGMMDSLARVDRIHDTMQRHITQLENEQKQTREGLQEAVRKALSLSRDCETLLQGKREEVQKELASIAQTIDRAHEERPA